MSSSLYQFASKIGKRFGYSKNSDVQIFEAEALFWLVMASTVEKTFTLKTLKKYLYQELYRYFYANLGSIKVSKRHSIRLSKIGLRPVNYDYLTEPICKDLSVASLNECINDICYVKMEKDYIHLFLDGYDDEQIAVILDVKQYVIKSLKNDIIEKLKNANLSSFSGFREICRSSRQ